MKRITVAPDVLILFSVCVLASEEVSWAFWCTILY